jgi:hypothetical protein
MRQARIVDQRKDHQPGSGPAASATANGRISPIALPTGRLPDATHDAVKVPIEMGGRRHSAPNPEHAVDFSDGGIFTDF